MSVTQSRLSHTLSCYVRASEPLAISEDFSHMNCWSEDFLTQRGKTLWTCNQQVSHVSRAAITAWDAADTKTWSAEKLSWLWRDATPTIREADGPPVQKRPTNSNRPSLETEREIYYCSFPSKSSPQAGCEALLKKISKNNCLHQTLELWGYWWIPIPLKNLYHQTHQCYDTGSGTVWTAVHTDTKHQESKGEDDMIQERWQGL